MCLKSSSSLAIKHGHFSNRCPTLTHIVILNYDMFLNYYLRRRINIRIVSSVCVSVILHMALVSKTTVNNIGSKSIFDFCGRLIGVTLTL
jgi:hypothetical protein